MKYLIPALLAVSVSAGCQSFAQGETARIVIAGDSTAADYPAARINQIGWGQALPYYLTDGVSVLNLAVNGRSTKSFIDEGKWDALVEKLRPGDVVLISFGHNDSRDDAPERYAAPMGAYKDNLDRFIADVRAAGGTPVILSPAARRLWEGPAMVETHGLYRLAAQQAAADSDAAFIDLSRLSLVYFEGIGREDTKTDFVWLSRPHWQTGETETLEDNTHFSFIGACGVANLIARELDAGGLAETVRTEGVRPNGGRPDTVMTCAETVRRESEAEAQAN